MKKVEFNHAVNLYLMLWLPPAASTRSVVGYGEMKLQHIVPDGLIRHNVGRDQIATGSKNHVDGMPWEDQTLTHTELTWCSD